MSGSLAGMPPAPMPPSLMGGGGGAPGGPTPAMGSRPNLGPVTQQSSNPGNASAAMLDIKNALNLLQKALPNLPMGDELHGTVLQCVTKLSKAASSIPEQPGLQAQSLMQMMRSMGQNPMQAALSKMLPQPGQGPAMPGQPG